MRNSRNDLGRMVREVWLEWAREQPNPKPSWLLSWEELSEPDREVDRRIGERLASHGWKDGERRIAELEQANRDLERLRVEASRERDKARERVAILEKVNTAMDHQFQAASNQADQFADCFNRCCAEKVELREQLTAMRTALLEIAEYSREQAVVGIDDRSILIPSLARVQEKAIKALEETPNGE